MLFLNVHVTSLLLAQYTITALSSSTLRPSLGNPAYESLGCYKDSHNRALPNWYELKDNTVEGCFRKALELEYTIFAVQYGGECWLDDKGRNGYDKYGTSTKCENGTGGRFANNVYKIKSEFIAMQRCKKVKASLGTTCGDTNLVALKHIGEKAKTKQAHYNVSEVIYIVKAKINLKHIDFENMNSNCELEVVYEKQIINHTFAIATAKSLSVWFAKPLLIDPNKASLNVRLRWGQQMLTMTAPDAVILFGIPIMPICPNTDCLSLYIAWRNYVRNTNQSMCVEDLEALKLRFKPCTATDPPSITQGPNSQQVSYGTIVNLECRVKSLISFQRKWYKDGELITNETKEMIQIHGTLETQGSYYCEISSLNFSVKSQKALVTLSDLLSSLIYMVIENKKYSVAFTGQNDRETVDQSMCINILKSVSDYFKKGKFKWKCKFEIRRLINASGHVGAEVLIYSVSTGVNIPRYYSEMKKLVEEGVKHNLFESLKISPLKSVQVSSLDYCLPETTGLKSLQGVFEWNLTTIGQTADLKCPYGPSGTKASRVCEGNKTVAGVWNRPDTGGCSYLSLTTEKLYNLSKTKVDNKNVKRIATQMKELTSGSKPKKLTGIDAALTAEVLEDVIAVPGSLHTTARDVMETISNVMQMNATLLANSQKDKKASSKLIKIIDLIGENLPLTDTQPSRLLTTSNIAIYSRKIDVSSFSGLSFAVRSSSSKDQTLSEDKILTKLTPTEEVETSISLPRDLFANQQNINSSTQMSFIVYQTGKFFQPIDENSSIQSLSINSRVIAASARNMKLRNITAPGVEMTFLLLDPHMVGGPVCAFWDFNALGGFGNWSDEGCKFVGMAAERVTCRCNHMTHFAVLFSVHGEKVGALEKEHIKALTIISYIGCGISLVGVTLTLVTYCLFSNLRKTNAQPILMNLCLSLMLLLIVFMVGSGDRENKYVCNSVAVLLHYFLLTTVTWMAVEGYQMYLAFIRVMATYTRHFMLKCSLIAWGVPAIIVISTTLGAIVAGVPQDLYINPDYCVLTGIPLYAAVFAPVLLILMINFIIFGVVIYSMNQSRALVSAEKRTTSYQRVRMALAILVLLGLTWVFGVLAIGSARLVFEYLFCIFNSLQGFFIFVFHCLRQKDAQRQWLALFKGKGTSYNPNVSEKQGKSSVPGFGSRTNIQIGAVSWRRQNGESSSVCTVADSPLPKRNSVLTTFFSPPAP